MWNHIRPLFPYLARYKRGLFFGGICVLLTNGIWVFFPEVLRFAVNDLNRGITEEKLLRYAGLVLALAAGKGIFQILTRWVLIGI